MRAPSGEGEDPSLRAEVAVLRAELGLISLQRRMAGQLTPSEWSRLSVSERDSREWEVRLSRRIEELITDRGWALAAQLREGLPPRGLLPPCLCESWSAQLGGRLAELAPRVASETAELAEPESTAGELLAHQILRSAREAAAERLSQPRELSRALTELSYAEDVLFDAPDALSLWELPAGLSEEEISARAEIENALPEQWFDPFSG